MKWKKGEMVYLGQIFNHIKDPEFRCSFTQVISLKLFALLKIRMSFCPEFFLVLWWQVKYNNGFISTLKIVLHKYEVLFFKSTK